MFQVRMTKKTFLRIENHIGESWGEILAEEMTKGGEEEKYLALQRNDSVHGYPAISNSRSPGHYKENVV